MKYLIACCALLSALASAESITEKAQNDDTVVVPSDDDLMRQAKHFARASLPSFLTLHQDPQESQTGFAVKVGITENGMSEFVWLSPFSQLESGEYSGKINNQPRYVKGVELGQKYPFDEADIVDWMYFENEVMKGNFTACAILAKQPPQEQAAFKARFGLECPF